MTIKGGVRISLLCAITLSGTACSARWIDDAGRVRIVGLVNMTVDPVDDSQRPAHLIVETLGTSLIMSPPATALSLGYSKDELYFVGFDKPDAAPVASSTEQGEEDETPMPR